MSSNDWMFALITVTLSGSVLMGWIVWVLTRNGRPATTNDIMSLDRTVIFRDYCRRLHAQCCPPEYGPIEDLFDWCYDLEKNDEAHAKRNSKHEELLVGLTARIFAQEQASRDFVRRAELGQFVTDESLAIILAEYARRSDLNNYVTTDQLQDLRAELETANRRLRRLTWHRQAHVLPWDVIGAVLGTLIGAIVMKKMPASFYTLHGVFTIDGHNTTVNIPDALMHWGVVLVGTVAGYVIGRFGQYIHHTFFGYGSYAVTDNGRDQEV